MTDTAGFIAPSSVLTVMAHPDDAELWAGGTLALCAAAGTTVTVAVLRHDDQLRNSEAATGAAIVGAELCLFEQASVVEVRELLLATRPEVVITHPLRDVHPEHRHLAHLLLDALPEVVIATGYPRRVYTADTYNGLTLDGPVPPATIVDITGTFETKQRALAAHSSQPIEDHFGPMAENLARLWGQRIGVPYAENFVPIPVLGRLPRSLVL